MLHSNLTLIWDVCVIQSIVWFDLHCKYFLCLISLRVDICFSDYTYPIAFLKSICFLLDHYLIDYIGIYNSRLHYVDNLGQISGPWALTFLSADHSLLYASPHKEFCVSSQEDHFSYSYILKFMLADQFATASSLSRLSCYLFSSS